MTIEQTITVIIAVVAVGVVNAIIFAFGYGKLSEKVDCLVRLVKGDHGVVSKVEKLEVDMAVVKRNCQAFHGIQAQE